MPLTSPLHYLLLYLVPNIYDTICCILQRGVTWPTYGTSKGGRLMRSKPIGTPSNTEGTWPTPTTTCKDLNLAPMYNSSRTTCIHVHVDHDHIIHIPYSCSFITPPPTLYHKILVIVFFIKHKNS